jgi:hypothetical protein
MARVKVCKGNAKVYIDESELERWKKSGWKVVGAPKQAKSAKAEADAAKADKTSGKGKK